MPGSFIRMELEHNKRQQRSCDESITLKMFSSSSLLILSRDKHLQALIAIASWNFLLMARIPRIYATRVTKLKYEIKTKNTKRVSKNQTRVGAYS